MCESRMTTFCQVRHEKKEKGIVKLILMIEIKNRKHQRHPQNFL